VIIDAHVHSGRLAAFLQPSEGSAKEHRSSGRSLILSSRSPDRNARLSRATRPAP